MKNKIIAALLLGAMLTMTTSCTRKVPQDYTESDTDAATSTEAAETLDASGVSGVETPASFNYMGTDLSAYITVGNYKGLSVTVPESEMTEAEYQDSLTELMNSFSYNEQITDRTVEAGETVCTSYAGYLDGVAFDGGTAEGQLVTAADGNGMIDGFGPAFVGQTPGVEFSFNVKFPTVYGNLDLAGKEVTFVCTIDYIQGETVITPELTDSFTRENFGYETVAEFEKMYREYVAAEKQSTIESTMYDDLWSQVMDASTVKAFPAGEVEKSYNQYRTMYESYAEMYGVTYEEFLANYIGATDENLQAQAQYVVKNDLVMYQLVKDMGIIVTDEEFNTEVNNIAAMYGASVEEIKAYYGETTLMATILWQKVMQNITAAANVTVGEG